MADKDWKQFGSDMEKLGDQIKKSVQDAVDSHDFRALNQSISNSINDAFGGIVGGIKSATSASNSQTPYAPPVNKAPIVAPRNNPTLPSRFDKKAQMFSPFFNNVTPTTIGGTALTVIGATLSVLSLIMGVVFLFGTLFGGTIGAGAFATSIVFGILTLVFGGVTLGGLSMVRSAKRFRKYIKALGNKEYSEFSTLAKLTGLSPKFIIKDTKRMIQKGWFRQGRIDTNNTTLMISDEAYQQYQSLLLQMENRKLLEEAVEKKEVDKNFEPEIIDTLRTGDAYIQKIKDANTAIDDAEVSGKLYQMQMFVERIFGRIKDHPESVSDIRRMLDYYLPTTVKLLDAYQELSAQPVQGGNIRASKQEIEKTLDTLNMAFEKILDGLFQSKAWDVSTDISVLNTMLAQEGLTPGAFDKTKQ